jgi:hypothetical protein
MQGAPLCLLLNTLEVSSKTAANSIATHPALRSPNMALQGILSPTKQMLCSPSKLQPLSPAIANISGRAVLSLSLNAKRCLSGSIQQGVAASLSGVKAPAALAFCATSGDTSGLSAAAVPLEQDAAQLPAAASAVAMCPSNPSMVQQPVANHRQPLSSAVSIDLCTQQQQQHTAGTTPTPAAATTAAAAGVVRTSVLQQRQPPGSVGALHRAAAGLSQPLLSQRSAFSSTSPAADKSAAVGQLPAGPAIMDFPPEVEGLPAASLPSDLQQGSHTPAMSGCRVTARYDVPLGLDWTQGLPDHVADLGEGQLELIMGPMFAGKTTQLIARVSKQLQLARQGAEAR